MEHLHIYFIVKAPFPGLPTKQTIINLKLRELFNAGSHSKRAEGVV
jgi:hypothetical protein